MKNERKQIVTVVDCDNLNELPATIAEFTANLGENEHLMQVTCRVGRSRDNTYSYAVEFTTIVGDIVDCFPPQM